jgi:hypothetical protein
MSLVKSFCRFIFASSITLVLTGCPIANWHELNFTRHKPSEADLIGRWIPTAKTRKEILKRGKYPDAICEIRINADGSFTMRNMPDWWRGGLGESHRRLESGSGVWKLSEPSSTRMSASGKVYRHKDPWAGWELLLRFASFSGEHPIPSGGATSVRLCRQSPPYQMFFYVGDPDSGDAMLFERESVQEPAKAK